MMALRTAAGILGLALLGALIFGIVYGAERNSRPGTSTAGDLSQLVLAADALSRHADEMRESSIELMAAGNAAGEQSWVDLANEHLEDAPRLDLAAERLRKMHQDLTLFPPDEGVRIVRLRADGRAVMDAGEVLLQHCEDMKVLSEQISAEAGPSAELGAFQEHLLADVDALREHGRAVVWAGQSLIERADILDRSLGR